MDFEQIKEEVWRKLPMLNDEELTQVCNGLSVTIPPKQMGKKSGKYNTAVKYLMSDDVEESDDEGEDIFRRLNGMLDKIVQGRVVKQESVANTVANSEGVGGQPSSNVTNVDGGSSVTPVSTSVPVLPATSAVSSSSQSTSSHVYTSTTAMSLGAHSAGGVTHSSGGGRFMTHRIQEFKIKNGTVGGGGERQLDYTSLLYQMEDGKRRGYTEDEIRSGVIAAMEVGSSMRKFFVSNPSLSQKDFMSMLKSKHEVKDSARLLSELGNCAQEPAEEEIDFVFRVLGLKNMIIDLSVDEGCPLGEEMVKKRCYHALSVGLRKETVRLEMQPILKAMELNDSELMIEFQNVVTKDTEHRAKVRNGKNAITGAVDADLLVVEEAPKGKKSAFEVNQEAILYELQEVRAAVKKVMYRDEERSSEIKALRNKVNGNNRSGEDNRDDRDNCDNRDDKGVHFRDKVDKRDNNGPPRYRKTFYGKCKTCEERNVYCTHCTRCGSGGHKKKDCEKDLSKNE